MSRLLSTLAAVVVVLTALAGMSSCAQKSTQVADIGNVPNGLKLTLLADCPEVQAGGVVTLTLSVRNVSDSNFHLHKVPWSESGSRLEWQVTGPGPEAVNVKRRVIGSMGVRFNAEDYPELHPGEERSFAFKITGNPPTLEADAASVVQLLKPGSYRIKAFFRNRESKLPIAAWTGQVTSNEIEVKFQGKFEPPAVEPWQLFQGAEK
jgi:hypothetical protein